MTTSRENHVARNTLSVHDLDCGGIAREVEVRSIGHTRRKLGESVKLDQCVLGDKNDKSGLTFNVRTDVWRGGA